MADMSPTALAQGDIMRELESFGPSEHEISAVKAALEADPLHDPIMTDLMKIQGRCLPTIPDEPTSGDPEYLVEQLSLRLRELLELILDSEVPDDARMNHEQEVKELISKEPKTKKGTKLYPNDYLSRILIDNYSLFLKISTLYFNLSLASLVTRYLVSLIYNLECWEIYHLLHVVPNLEYILRLLDFDISCTSFGHIVRPPENFLNFNLRQGLQYPFPFPFYNFSYHSIDPEASVKKLEKVSIKPYIDLRLEKLKQRAPRKNNGIKLTAKLPRPMEPETSLISDSDSSANSDDFRRWKIVYLFVEMTPERIQHDFDFCFVTPNQRVYEEEDYDSDRARLIEAKEQETIDASMPGLPVTPSVFQKAFTKAYDTGLVKHTFLHQCKLMDPTSHKTCLKVFYGKNELHRHQEFVHATKKRMYRCVYCPKIEAEEKNKVYPRYDSLARHIRRKHGIVGSENKLAVLLARRVAESEDIFGKQPVLPFEESAKIMKPASQPRVSVTEVPDSSPKVSRLNPEGRLGKTSPEQCREMLLRSDEKQTRKAVALGEPRKCKRKASDPISLDRLNIPYNEFKFASSSGFADAGPVSHAAEKRTESLNAQAASEAAYSKRPAPSVLLESSATTENAVASSVSRSTQKESSSPGVRFENELQPTPMSTTENKPVTGASNLPPYSQQFSPHGIYAPGYSLPVYSVPEGNFMYGHGLGMRLPPQNESGQFPYMHQMYASAYAGEPQAPAADRRSHESARKAAASQHTNTYPVYLDTGLQFAKNDVSCSEDRREDRLENHERSHEDFHKKL